MKTTNINNNTAAVQTYCVRTCKTTGETAYSDHTHLSTDVKVHAFDDVESALNIPCVSYAEYIARGLGEETVFTSDDAFRQWKESVTMETIAQYQVYEHRFARVFEYSFAVRTMPKITSKAPGKLVGVQVYDNTKNELITQESFVSTKDALDYADNNFIAWKYPNGVVRDIAIFVMGVDVSKYYDSRYRKNCKIYTDNHSATQLTVDINDYGMTDEASAEDESFVCSICGEVHSVKEGIFNPAPVRPANKPDGSRNCCCMHCYESYVGPLYAFMFVFPIFRGHDEKYAKYPDSQDEYIDMLMRSSTDELDAFIKEADIGRLAMNGLRFLEANRAAAEKKRIKEDERKARARERARERRAAAKAAKLAEQETK